MTSHVPKVSQSLSLPLNGSFLQLCIPGLKHWPISSQISRSIFYQYPRDWLHRPQYPIGKSRRSTDGTRLVKRITYSTIQVV